MRGHPRGWRLTPSLARRQVNRLPYGVDAECHGCQQGRPAWPGRWTIASGVYRLATVRGLTDASVYLVQSGSVWVLIDTAWPHREQFIRDAAESLFGAGTRPPRAC